MPMSDQVLRATKWALHPKGDSILSKLTIEIEVEDEGAGEFLLINQPLAKVPRGIAIDP